MLGDAAALRPARAAPARRRRGGRRRAAGAQHDAARRRADRRGERRARCGSRARSRADGVRALHVPRARNRPRHPRALVQARTGGAARGARSRRSASPRRSSSRSGGCRAASRDFVTVVVPELFGSAIAPRAGRGTRASSRSSSACSPSRASSSPTSRSSRERDEAEPERLVARVLVSGVNAASMRAVNYAQTLGVDDVRAVHFAFSGEDARAIREEWRAPRAADPARGRRGAVPRRRPPAPRLPPRADRGGGHGRCSSSCPSSSSAAGAGSCTTSGRST